MADEPEKDFEGTRNAAREKLFDKGQSKRIWGELYKVIDSSDVVVQACIDYVPSSPKLRPVSVLSCGVTDAHLPTQGFKVQKLVAAEGLGQMWCDTHSEQDCVTLALSHSHRFKVRQHVRAGARCP